MGVREQEILSLDKRKKCYGENVTCVIRRLNVMIWLVDGSGEWREELLLVNLPGKETAPWAPSSTPFGG